MSFCPSCGTKILEDQIFCFGCGQKIGTDPEQLAANFFYEDKQEKIFFEYERIDKKLIISSDLIKCTYKKFFFSEKRIFIVSRNINSFECKSYTALRIFGGILVAISMLLLGLTHLPEVSDFFLGVTFDDDIKVVLSCIALLLLVFGLPRLFLRPKIKVFSGKKDYDIPIGLFGSKDDLLNAIQLAVSYKK